MPTGGKIKLWSCVCIMKKIKNIFFDFGRTIVEHPADEAGRRIIKNAGVIAEEDVYFLQKEVFSGEKYLNILDEDLMRWDEYLNKLINAVPERLIDYALCIANYRLNQLPLIEGMEELLKKLKQDGFKLYITSNLDKYHSEQLKNSSIAVYFEDMAFSSHLKVRKPYDDFFVKACEKFGVSANECLLIDDLKENIEGAKKCGLQGYIFDGNVKKAEEFIYNCFSH